MIKVAAITGGKNVPSSRFRLRQYFASLADHGIQAREYCPPLNKYAEWPLLGDHVAFRYKFPMTGALWALKAASRLPGVFGSWQCDLTWLSRDLVVGIPTLEPLLRKPLILDVDDAIWCTWPFGRDAATRTARHSALVIAGNARIADWFSTHAKEVAVIPTAVDSTRFRPRSCQSDLPPGPVVAGWIGSASNLSYLHGIAPALKTAMDKHPALRLRVVSNEPPHLPGIDPARVDFIRWSPEREGSDVATMDIGLMPLPDTEWTRAKCSLKMLQYLACGLPVCVSPIGMNQEILEQASVGFGPRTMDEWVDALLALCDRAVLRRELGSAGRALVEARYSIAVVTPQLAALFGRFR